MNNKGSHTPWDCVRVGRGNARLHLPRCPRGARTWLPLTTPLFPGGPRDVQPQDARGSLSLDRFLLLLLLLFVSTAQLSLSFTTFKATAAPLQGRACCFHSGSLQSRLEFPRDSHLVLEELSYSHSEIKSFVYYYFFSH